MRLFRKHKPAHQLVATRDQHKQVIYRCSVCTRTFYSVGQASWQSNKEWCPGKHCYTEANLNPFRTSEDAIPAYLIRGDKLKEERRAIGKGQEPLAYLCFELMRKYGGFSEALQAQEYIPLYDVRECIALDGAIPLPAFE